MKLHNAVFAAATSGEWAARAIRRFPSLAAAVVSVLRDRDLRDRCREAGPAVVRNHFSTGAIGQQLARMYQTVLAVDEHD